jgi:hypothetical protein
MLTAELQPQVALEELAVTQQAELAVRLTAERVMAEVPIAVLQAPLRAQINQIASNTRSIEKTSLFLFF